MSDVEGRAAAFAVLAHREQKRKGGEPYICHPARVANLLRATAHANPSSLAAAWLHDVVEDCGVTLAQIGDLFGDDARQLVWWLTSWSKHPHGPPELKTANRKVRKAADREYLSKAPIVAQTIKVCDLLDNADGLSTHEPDFAPVFLREMSALLDVLTKADPGLLAQARAVVARDLPLAEAKA